MSVLFDYVSAEARQELKHLNNYKFEVTNVSISEKLILNNYWNFITNKLYPEWLAPNVITLLGFICMLGVQILVWVDYPTVPRYMIWTFAVIPVLMFLYQTLDGSDGKQARRTGASSPLGEIFDHGVDAVCLSIFAQSMCLVLGVTPLTSPGPYIALIFVIQWFTFFTSHWEHYHTGTFFMGYVGACDAQLAIMLLFFVAFLSSLIAPQVFPQGEGIWSTKMFLNISIGDAVYLFIILNATVACFRCAWSIFNHYRKPSTQTRRDREAQHRYESIAINGGYDTDEVGMYVPSTPMSNFRDALCDLIPLLVTAIMFFGWLVMAHFATISEFSGSIKYTNLFQRDFMFYTSVGGMIFGVHLTTLNVARTTNQVYSRFTPQYVFVTLGMFIHMFSLVLRLAFQTPLINDSVLIYIVFAYTVVYYSIFVILVGRGFTSALNIYAFRIKKKVPLVEEPPQVIVDSDSESSEVIV